jgi:hypothetical protein
MTRWRYNDEVNGMKNEKHAMQSSKCMVAAGRGVSTHFRHDPGIPPHLPHVGPAAPGDLPDSELTEKTLSARAVLVEPHPGHLTAVFVLTDPPPSLVIDRTSCSNFLLQDLHVYS